MAIPVGLIWKAWANLSTGTKFQASRRTQNCCRKTQTSSSAWDLSSGLLSLIFQALAINMTFGGA